MFPSWEQALTGTIRSDGPSATEWSFRYAPLSSGLDIVRKTLSRYEIATVQTTSIDETVGIVRLSTVLAHASGEWIASDWPVCAISDTATRHHMGAALTYARRYALFTLVGIAGEDDRDAPDLIAPEGPASNAERFSGNKTGHQKGSQNQSTQHLSKSSSKVTVEPEASAALRDQLTAELQGLKSAAEAANWAHRALPAKNSLTAADAERVERAFQARLMNIATETEPMPQQDGSQLRRANRGKKRRRILVINKSVLSLADAAPNSRPRARQISCPAALSGLRPTPGGCAPSALYASRALGRKVSDEFTVPLCRGHHREVHHCSDEAAW